MEKRTCIFMGTPQIAADVLQAMLDASISIDLVVTQPDKKVGRKQVLSVSPVKALALEYNIPTFQPRNIKEDYQRIVDMKPDIIVTCAYGQIVPSAVLEAPKYNCVNLHGSLLPKYRGGAPIQRALWNQEKETGMSLMRMVEAMDAGPVLAKKVVPISKEDTSTTLFNQLGKVAGQLIVEYFDEVCSENANFIDQNLEEVTYAPIITKAEERIDLSQDDQTIFHQIRALSKTPGGYVMLKNKKFKILDASYHASSVKSPYTVLGWQEDGYAISLQEGFLSIKECQMEGKPAMDAKAFYNGQGRNLVKEKVE